MNEENNSRQSQPNVPPFANIPPYQESPPVRPMNVPPSTGQPGPVPLSGPPPYPIGYGANMPPPRPGPMQQGVPQYQGYPTNAPPPMGPYPPQGGPAYQPYPPPQMYVPGMLPQMTRMPKCTSCGAITPWQVEPVLTATHIIITLVLLLFFGTGLIYLLIVAIIRSNPDNRAKICPHCHAKNMWTFTY